MSEWLSDCCLMPIQQFFSYSMSRTNYLFNEMMMRSALFLTNTLSWIFIVLAHWNNSTRVDMSLHSDTVSWFRANRSLLFFLNAACLAERSNKYQFLVFGLTWLGLEPTIYHTWGEHANHYATDADWKFL